jgi:hypothetical protein
MRTSWSAQMWEEDEPDERHKSLQATSRWLARDYPPNRV